MKYPTLLPIIESASSGMCLGEDSLERVAGFLKQNAQPWLNAANKGRIRAYRGVKSMPKCEFGFISTPRTDRMAQDLSVYTEEILDAMYSQAGLRTRRSNSIFVSNDEEQADAFSGMDGDVVCVVPLGKFEFSWFSNTPDIADMSPPPQASYYLDPQRYEQELERYKGMINLRIFDLYEWVAMEHDGGVNGWEAAIWCEKYYAVEQDIYRQIMPLLS